MTDTPTLKKAPAFQFYASDFLASVMTMTNEERGAYITLLCIQWDKGWVTQVDFQRITAGMPPHSFGICQSMFQTDANGNLINSRLERVRAQQVVNKQKQVDNANKRWEHHAKSMPDVCQTYAMALPTHMPNVCSPTPTPIKDNTDAPKSPRVRFQKPTVDELTAEALKIGLPVTEVDKFFNYYESIGWKIGRNQMKSWPHTLKNWLARIESTAASVAIKATKEIDWRDSL